MKAKTCILFLNENPLPCLFTQGTIAGKELRLRSAQTFIDEVHVISRRGPTVEDITNTKIGVLEKKIVVHLLPNWPYYLAGIPLFIWGLYYALKLKPLTIEAESPIISGPAAILIGKIMQIPTIIEFRASYEELIKQKLLFIPMKMKSEILSLVSNFSLHNASAVIANSNLYHKQLLKKGIKSVVINPGLQYPPKIIPTKMKRACFTIGYLGRLVPEKGVDLLIKAFANLDQKKVKLKIAGEGPFRPHLEKLCKELNIQKNVSFLGFQPSYKILSHWDVMANTNTVKHPLEMANAEAIYMGVPVICFGNDEYPETVINNVTGIKISNQQITDLTETINRLIYHPEKYIALRKKCQEKNKNYLFKNQVLKLTNLYLSLRRLNLPTKIK